MRHTEPETSLEGTSRALSFKWNVTGNRNEPLGSDFVGKFGTGILLKSEQPLENCTARAPKLHGLVNTVKLRGIINNGGIGTAEARISVVSW